VLGADVPPGARHLGRVDVDGMQFDRAEGRGQCGAYRPRAAAQVDNDRPRAVGGPPGAGGAGARGGLLDEELAAAARNEDAGAHGYPQPAELGPPNHLLDRQAGGAPVHHDVELGWGRSRAAQQPRLILGEDAAGGAEPADDNGLLGRGGRARGLP
jgi:hypothetical protein